MESDQYYNFALSLEELFWTFEVRSSKGVPIMRKPEDFRRPGLREELFAEAKTLRSRNDC